MKRLLIFLFLTNLLIIKSLAQEKPPKYLEDKYSWYAGLNLGMPVGKYNTVLEESNNAGTKGGLYLGGLINPYKRKKASTVFYGAEIGFQSDGSDAIQLNAPGDFHVTTSTSWLNGVARYRPILWSSKFNPYADAFFGAKMIKTTVVEKINQEDSQDYETYRRIMPNYGLGVGLGIKLSGQLKNKYLDVGLYYQQADATKIIKRNSMVLSSTYQVSYKQVATSTNQIVIKIGLTGFL